jgi:triosephosphate isomerase
MRKKIVAGNWKMNLNLKEGKDLIEQILAELPTLNEHNQVVLATP